ncbi:hypothetical protein GQ55_3G416400 [Panicum hallii var. hallii]|uniref:Uncharacterized protein n=1 Tax=Panicum hallii var. hallii TaxID=1504633 RepID=A0A2T7EHA2_9POAL|nr:hypothetical protein GQ55_3G416400 [Panicum hallii var. hallii]
MDAKLRGRIPGTKLPRIRPTRGGNSKTHGPARRKRGIRPSQPPRVSRVNPRRISGNGGCGGAAIGAGARGAARFGEMTHLGGRIRVGGGGGSRRRRRSLPRAAGEEGTEGGEPTLGRLSVPYFSGRSFFDTVPQVSANQIPAPDVDKVTAR